MSHSQPPPYAATAPPMGFTATTAPPMGFTPATNYQPGQPVYPHLPPQQHQSDYPPKPVELAPPAAPPTVIIQHTITTTVGNRPTHMTCPSCRAEVDTTVLYESNGRTHCFALLLCLFGCWPCVCVPYCMESCKSANHYCPNCNAYIGTFEN